MSDIRKEVAKNIIKQLQDNNFTSHITNGYYNIDIKVDALKALKEAIDLIKEKFGVTNGD